ncbi:Doublecortin Domain-Containing Protein 2 [Manis pentadactyla]|nr:Doublecortin Domain-Containing Protein 2 [Manis pentadactyla]
MSGARNRHSLQAHPAVKSVLVYRNGDPFFAGRRVVLREKGCRFDALLREATRGVRAPGRPSRPCGTSTPRGPGTASGGWSRSRAGPATWPGSGRPSRSSVTGHRRNQEKTNGSHYRDFYGRLQTRRAPCQLTSTSASQAMRK